MNHTDEQAPAITLQLLVTTLLQLPAACCMLHVQLSALSMSGLSGVCLVFLTIPHYIGPWLLATNVQDQ